MIDRKYFAHPRGVYVLFFTELWERFSFYGMRAILILYLVRATTSANPGLGWSEAEALSLYGWYTAAVYFFGVIGGYIADRWWGALKSIRVGGWILCCGHLVLAFPAVEAFYLGLCLIILGVSLLKPNVSSLVGDLYDESDYEGREYAYTLFYVGINLGSIFAPLVIGYIGEAVGWHYGFAVAGIGMALGQLVFLWGQKHLPDTAGIRTPMASLAPSRFHKPKSSFSAEEWDRIKVLIAGFALTSCFMAAFEQAGGLIALFANQYTNLEIYGWKMPTSWVQSFNPFFIITCGFLVSRFWVSAKQCGRDARVAAKFSCGMILTSIGFWALVAAAYEAQQVGQSRLSWLVLAFFCHSLGELCIVPVIMNSVNKFAPASLKSTMMGALWFAVALGAKMAGVLGELSEKYGDLQVFAFVAAECMVIGVLFLFLRNILGYWSHGADFGVEGVEKPT
ncbi:MAG: peptide MFS transporter [Zetaproteobacteria bacterium]|nr:peptide MFS transporter [Zetaproteobacteria bacterium]